MSDSNKLVYFKNLPPNLANELDAAICLIWSLEELPTTKQHHLFSTIIHHGLHNCLDRNGWTLLMHAVRRNQPKIVQFLLFIDVDTTVCDDYGYDVRRLAKVFADAKVMNMISHHLGLQIDAAEARKIAEDSAAEVSSPMLCVNYQDCLKRIEKYAHAGKFETNCSIDMKMSDIELLTQKGFTIEATKCVVTVTDPSFGDSWTQVITVHKISWK